MKINGRKEISIHVPHAGHDRTGDAGIRKPGFQSTCPMRGTTSPTWRTFGSLLFQSTCPMRGTTTGQNRRWELSEFQSTCPMRGTTQNRSGRLHRPIFQSTCPMRGTTWSIPRTPVGIYISIHVPHAGHDWSIPSTPVGIYISIHVPHAGHDGPNPKSETFLCSNLVSSSKISIQATCFCKTISEIQDFLGANVPPSEQQLPVRTDVFIFRPRICNPFTFLRVSVRLPDRRKYLFHSVRSGFDTCFPGCRIEDCLYQNHRYPAIGFSTQYTLPDPHHIEKQSSALFDHRIHRPLRFSPVSSVPLQLLYLRRTLSK